MVRAEQQLSTNVGLCAPIYMPGATVPSYDDLDRLQALATDRVPEQDWADFERYLDLRAKGLRRASMEALQAFVVHTRCWDFDRRRRFVTWICDCATDFFNSGLLISSEILVDLIRPTVREWLSRDPGSSLAHYLSGKYCRGDDVDPPPLDAFRRSVQLDPSFQRARRAFIDFVIRHVEYAQHELPHYGYLGSATEDEHVLAEAIGMLSEVENPQMRERFGTELADMLAAATAWQRFEQSGCRDFVQWCEANGGPAQFSRDG